MKLTINVRPQEDDSTNICTLCPVAQALRVAVGLPRATIKNATRHEAFAQPSRLYARGKSAQIECLAPKEVAEWIKRWDATGEGEAFSFEVKMTSVTAGNAALGEFIFPNFGGHYDRLRSHDAKVKAGSAR